MDTSNSLRRRRKSFSDTNVESFSKLANSLGQPIETLNWFTKEEIVEGMAISLYHNIHNSTSYSYMDEVWSEWHRPLGGEFADLILDQPPTVYLIRSTIKSIFKKGFSSIECCVMALVFIDRLTEYTGFQIQPKNWRRVLLAALIIACKVWEDESVWNVDFVDVFPNLNSEELLLMEKSFLQGLDFNLHVKHSLYARYYFEIGTRNTRSQTLY